MKVSSKTAKPQDKTFNQMLLSKEISKRNAYQISIDLVLEEQGFNLREESADLQESVVNLAQFIADGGTVPALEVRPNPDGYGVIVVDGHRRRRAYIHARDVLGTEITMVPVEAFNGGEKERIARIISSADGRPLSQLEQGEGFQRLIDRELSSSEIAKMVGRTRQQVDNLLILHNAPDSIKQMVRDGKISATLAVEQIKLHGDKAAEKLEKDLNKAESEGKKKVTSSASNGKKIPVAAWEELYKAVGAMLEDYSNDQEKMALQAAYNEIADLKD